MRAKIKHAHSFYLGIDDFGRVALWGIDHYESFTTEWPFIGQKCYNFGFLVISTTILQLFMPLNSFETIKK